MGVSDDQPVIEGTLVWDGVIGWVVQTESESIPLVPPRDWDGQHVRVMRREGHAAEWIVIERGRE